MWWRRRGRAGTADRDQGARRNRARSAGGRPGDPLYPHVGGADASARSLQVFVCEAVEPGSRVRADGWPSYSQLEGLGNPDEVTVLLDPHMARQ